MPGGTKEFEEEKKSGRMVQALQAIAGPYKQQWPGQWSVGKGNTEASVV